ncbi:uncharacterized protein LOC122508026 [Leptopilina heterotoma]|uniref:uncharacterized protein LOC122508026 n=1 Tax=Leptopilina heterotoma TaxID=63436 RepID=UPI001CAA27FC|nr:uncharacterized protein LOC122508026 [Leptopilina heterotoma]
MKFYKFLTIYLCSLIEQKIIKSEWVELPQFSNSEKVYRTSIQLDRFFHSPRNESEIITRPPPPPSPPSLIQLNYQRVDKFHKNSEKIIYHQGLQNLILNDTLCTTTTTTTTVLPIDLTTESVKKSKNTTSIDGNKNIEKNRDDAPKEQLNRRNKFEKEEVYQTCSSDESKTVSNVCKNSQEEENFFNETKNESSKRFLYYLPVTLFKNVHLILKTQPHSLKGKIKFLRNFEKVLLSEIETRLAASIVPYTKVKKNSRVRRFDEHHHDEDSLGFPSLEGALMAISFLTFAVYLVRLIMLLFQNFASPTGGQTLFLGRRKRATNHLNDDAERILSYLYK